MSAPECEHIVLSVSKDSEYMKFHVVKPADLTGLVFDVTTNELADRSGVLRKRVEDLGRRYRQNSDPDARWNAMLEEVRDVAQAGRELRSLLFGEREARDIEERLKLSNGRLTFAVNYNVPVHPPYGLMFGYSGSKTASVDLKEPELRTEFWRDMHEVSIVYLTSDRTPSLTEFTGAPLTLRSEGIEVFGAFHQGALTHVQKHFPVQWTDNVAYSGRQLKTQFTQRAADTNILYFFCHADGQKLTIGSVDDDEDDNCFWPASLRAMILDRCPPPKGLILLNGCKTAVLHGNGAWLRAARTGGFVGFVGTEATIPTTFAWSFGNDFLKYILSEGKTPLEALKILWKRHWPLSLLYGLCCIADMQIMPPTKTDYLSDIVNTNYSHRPHCGGEMATLPFEDRAMEDGVKP